MTTDGVVTKYGYNFPLIYCSSVSTNYVGKFKRVIIIFKVERRFFPQLGKYLLKGISLNYIVRKTCVAGMEFFSCESFVFFFYLSRIKRLPNREIENSVRFYG